MPSQGFRSRLQLGVELPDEELSEPLEPTWHLFGELGPRESEMLVKHPQGFEVFAQAVGPGTPEAWRAALETLRGTMPWWLSQQHWWLDGIQGEAAEEQWVRSGATIPLTFHDVEDVEF